MPQNPKYNEFYTKINAITANINESSARAEIEKAKQDLENLMSDIYRVSTQGKGVDVTVTDIGIPVTQKEKDALLREAASALYKLRNYGSPSLWWHLLPFLPF